MKRAVVAMLVVAGVGVGSALSATPTATVRALVWERNTLSLATLDATSLVPRGQQLELGRAHGSVFTDQLGDRLAVASEGAGIVVVDTRRWKIVWRLQRGYAVRGVAWLSPRRLLVAEHGSVLLLDPGRRRIVAQTRYEGQVIGSARWRRGLVLLAEGGAGSIEPARLVIVGPGARIRTVEVGRIASGRDGGESNDGPFRWAQPGLGVDVRGGRAYVAGGMEVASIDLETLRVTYQGAERTMQKAISGPRRVVASLGYGLLVISGDDRAARADGTSSTNPFGLRYVGPDGVRVVDELVSGFELAGDLVLAVGYRSIDGHSVAIGLAAYDRTGGLRWRLFGDAPVGISAIVRGRAYVVDRRTWYVVDVASGSIVGEMPTARWDYLKVLA